MQTTGRIGTRIDHAPLQECLAAAVKARKTSMEPTFVTPTRTRVVAALKKLFQSAPETPGPRVPRHPTHSRRCPARASPRTGAMRARFAIMSKRVMTAH